MNTQIRPLPALVMAAALAFVLAPIVTPPFTGYLPGQMPVSIGRPAIQPAGYAFSIWGVIYAWLLAHAAFGLLRRGADPVWERVRWPLIGALALGSLWLAIASHWPIAATLTIAVMAGCALTAFLRSSAMQDRWLLLAPLSIFAGWLTAATLVSLGVVLAGFGLLTNAASASVMLMTAVVLGLWFQSRQPGMPLYGATLVWALIGIYMANAVDLAPIAFGAALAAGIMALGSAALWLRQR